MKNNDIDTLLSIMARLRDPDRGCPWDIKQDYHSLAPYTVEEAYEVADAVNRNDMNDLKEELGDLLLQVVFFSQMAAEDGHFTFDDVVTTLNDKLVRRHPHVFGDKTAKTAEDVKILWEQVKDEEEREKAEKLAKMKIVSALGHIPANMPAMLRAAKMEKRARKVGFDWANIRDTVAKLHEVIDELLEEVDNNNPDGMEDEMGDVLFTAIVIAGRLHIDAEKALTRTNAKFIRRFQGMEKILALSL